MLIGVITSQIIGIFVYITLATIITWKFCNERLLTPQTFEEIQISLNAFMLGTPLSLIFKYFMFPYLKIYMNIMDYGYFYLFFNLIIYFIGFDFINYLLHRLLHLQFFYRNIHSLHHKYRNPSPFAAIAVHPLEFFLNSVIPSTIMAFIIPTHYYVWLFSYGFHLFWSVLIHDGLKNNSMGNLIMDAKHHGIHHKKPLTNYAFIISYWDVFFNTYSE